MHGVGYPGAARDRQAIDIDRFQGHGQFFFLSTWPRRVMEECRQSSRSSLYIMLRDSQRLKHMHTHTEGVKEWSRLTFPIVFPTHSLTDSLTPSPLTHPYPVTLLQYLPPTVQVHMFPKSKKQNKKTSESNRPRYMTYMPAYLTRYLLGWVGVSLLHLRHPVSSQSKSVSLVHVPIVPNYLMYVGIHMYL